MAFLTPWLVLSSIAIFPVSWQKTSHGVGKPFIIPCLTHSPSRFDTVAISATSLFRHANTFFQWSHLSRLWLCGPNGEKRAPHAHFGHFRVIVSE
jgi:hypothetical protein